MGLRPSILAPSSSGTGCEAAKPAGARPAGHARSQDARASSWTSQSYRARLSELINSIQTQGLFEKSTRQPTEQPANQPASTNASRSCSCLRASESSCPSKCASFGCRSPRRAQRGTGELAAPWRPSPALGGRGMPPAPPGLHAGGCNPPPRLGRPFPAFLGPGCRCSAPQRGAPEARRGEQHPRNPPGGAERSAPAPPHTHLLTEILNKIKKKSPARAPAPCTRR